MRLDIFLQKQANIKAENKLLRFVVVFMFLITLFNTFMLYSSMNNQKVVLVPVGALNKETFVTGNTADEEYLKAMARYISALAFNYHPANVRSQFNDLLKLYATESFAQARKTFYELADVVETMQVSSVFYVTAISVLEGNKLRLSGNHYKLTADGRKIDEKVANYVITFKIKNGTFKIVDIAEEGQ